MIGLETALNELVIANRILANEDVVDAYGHVSVRHPANPERFFMSHMLAPPEMVERGDLIEFNLDGQAVSDRRTPSIERFIHAGIYAARPDVQAVVHAHAEDSLPFAISEVPLRPVIHSGSFIGAHVRSGTSPIISEIPIFLSPTPTRVAIWRAASERTPLFSCEATGLLRCRAR